MTKFRKYGSIIIIMLFMVQGINSQGLKNNGAYIFTVNKSFIRVQDMDVKNENNGSIDIKIGSVINVKGDVFNTSGDFNLRDSSFAVVDSNFNNVGNMYINDTTHIWVKKNLINSGYIWNQYIIEIGECN